MSTKQSKMKTKTQTEKPFFFIKELFSTPDIEMASAHAMEIISPAHIFAFDNVSYNNKWKSVGMTLASKLGQHYFEDSDKSEAYQDAFAKGLLQLHKLDVLTILPIQISQEDIEMLETKLEELDEDDPDFFQTSVQFQMLSIHEEALEKLETMVILSRDHTQKVGKKLEFEAIQLYPLLPREHIADFNIISDTENIDVERVTRDTPSILKYENLEFYHGQITDKSGYQYKKTVIVIFDKVFVIKTIHEDTVKTLSEKYDKIDFDVDEFTPTDYEVDVYRQMTLRMTTSHMLAYATIIMNLLEADDDEDDDEDAFVEHGDDGKPPVMH